MWRKKKTLQISWHLQTLASASLFTSRLSRNVTAVFPFFFFLFFSFLFFFFFNYQTSFCSLQIYSVMYTIISLLVTLRQQCKQRGKRADPTLHKTHAGSGTKTCQQYVRALSDRRRSSLVNIFVRYSHELRRLKAEVTQESQLLVSSTRGCKWISDCMTTNVNAPAVQRQTTPGQTQD